MLVPKDTDRLHHVLNAPGRSSIELAQSAVKWMASLLPDTRSLIAVLAANRDVGNVIASDDALRSADNDSFIVESDSILRTALDAPGVARAAVTHDLRRRLLGGTDGEREQSEVSCLALPQVVPGAVIVLFHGPDSVKLVDNALASLAEVLSQRLPAAPPDPAIYAVISRAKLEWELTVDALGELVLLVDRRRQVLRANRTVERWRLGSVGAIRGATLHAVLHPACSENPCHLERMLNAHWETLRTTGSTSFGLFDAQLDKALEITLQVTTDDDGPPDFSDASFCVVVVSDVTELQLTQRELRELNDELEIRVAVRTQQLQESNLDLREQITRREIAERALQASRDELAKLSEKLLNTQESERRRIALELHDSVGQSLGALKYTLERFVAINENPELGDPASVLKSAVTQLQRAISDTRSISMSLRPSLLDDMGAVSAVEWLCRWFRETYVDVEIAFDHKLTDAQIPEDLAAPVFRIIQEALNNVAKHASASTVLVRLRRSGSRLEIEVKDDGVGFDEDDKISRTMQGMGIVGMRERALMTGGKFSVISEPGCGTRIQVKWNLASPRPGQGPTG